MNRLVELVWNCLLKQLFKNSWQFSFITFLKVFSPLKTSKVKFLCLIIHILTYIFFSVFTYTEVKTGQQFRVSLARELGDDELEPPNLVTTITNA